MKRQSPVSLSGRRHVTWLPTLAVSVMIGSSCGGGATQPTDEVIEAPFYRLQAGSADGSGGTYAGENTLWRPGIGHMELGPDPTEGEPIASFWMDAAPACLDVSTGRFDTGSEACGFNFFFYSIQFPQNNLGDQNAYSYSFNGNADIHELEVGVDANGISFIRGAITAGFTGNAPAIGDDVPADVVVQVSFTAVDRWPPR